MEAVKRIMAVAAACLLLGAEGYYTGMTLSFLTEQKQTVNQLSFADPALDAVLTEPSWREENGIQVLPEAVIPKDPQITNTSQSGLDELVAVQITFVYTESCPDPQKRGEVLNETDMACVADVFAIDYNADAKGSWVRFTGESRQDAVQHFYYRETLPGKAGGKGETTAPLFTQLTADRTAGNPRYSRLQAIGGFAIRIRGSVLQQIENETQYGLNSAREAYEAGLFDFSF